MTIVNGTPCSMVFTPSLFKLVLFFIIVKLLCILLLYIYYLFTLGWLRVFLFRRGKIKRSILLWFYIYTTTSMLSCLLWITYSFLVHAGAWIDISFSVTVFNIIFFIPVFMFIVITKFFFYANLIISLTTVLVIYMASVVIASIATNAFIFYNLFFIFILLVILVIIRGGAPRYRMEQLSKFNINTLLPAAVIFSTIVIFFIFML